MRGFHAVLSRTLVLLAASFAFANPVFSLPPPIDREPPGPCTVGSTRSCMNTHGCAAQKTCVDSARGPRWGACTGGGSTNCRCAPGAVASCQPGAGACGKKTCAADGNSFGACAEALCGVCAPGAKQSCDYRGSAGSSHCSLGEQTCNGHGSGFDACVDPGFRCGSWGNIDMKECASTGIAKHAGVLAGIPSGDSSELYVMNHKATVFGTAMNAKAYSSDIWGNAWGSFAVPNSSCFVFHLSYLKTCSSPFTGSILYMNPNTGRTFGKAPAFPA